MTEPQPATVLEAQTHEPMGPRHVPLVIVNPASAHGKARSLLKLLDSTLAKGRGELVRTTAPGDAERIAFGAAREGRPLVAVGGDGTISEIASGILAAGCRVPLGIVPAGNGNDYAYGALDLPRDPAAALELALTGLPERADAGQVNDRFFVNTLGVGIDANIAAAAEQLKHLPLLRGQRLYWTASLRELLLHYDRCPALTVSYDAQPPIQRFFALAAISLGPTYGGGFRINPHARIDDGLFDLCLIWKPSLLRALRLLPRIERGQHLDQPEVTTRRVRRVRLEATRSFYAHIDGEVITAQRLQVQILPDALLIRRQRLA